MQRWGWRCRGFVLPGKFVLPESLHPQAGCPSRVPPVHTRSTRGECVWNVSITSKIMFNMFQTYCIKQIPQQYLKRILFFILIDCKCIKHMLRIYFIYCICKILSNLYRRKPQSHHRIGSRAGPFGKFNLLAPCISAEPSIWFDFTPFVFHFKPLTPLALDSGLCSTFTPQPSALV